LGGDVDDVDDDSYDDDEDRHAGWYADPLQRHASRLWDGHVWTRKVKDGAAQAVDVLASTTALQGAPAPGKALPPRRAVRETDRAVWTVFGGVASVIAAVVLGVAGDPNALWLPYFVPGAVAGYLTSAALDTVWSDRG
jgi:hypothetical protein